MSRESRNTDLWKFRLYFALYIGGGGFISPFLPLFYEQVGLTGTQMGLLTSLGGAVVLILHGDMEALVSLRFNSGDLWMLLAVALWTVYSVLLRRRPEHVPPLALHTASVGAGTLWMLPLFGWEAVRGAGLPTELSAWLAIGFVAVFSSAIAHALWVRGVASIGPNRASVFIHLMPLFGAVLAITFLGEELAVYHVLGAALVLVGVVLSSRR